MTKLRRALTLEGSVGIAPANINSTMRFEVFGYDKVPWESAVLTQDPKRPGTSRTENFKIDVSGLETLELKMNPIGSNKPGVRVFLVNDAVYRIISRPLMLLYENL
jgi:hypothetical protein